MFEQQHRQRAMRPEVKAAREAAEVVRPLQRQLHAWQVETAHLIGLGEEVRRRGLLRPGCLDQARALSKNVDSARLSLRQKAAALPSSVAGSPTMVDTARAIDGIARSIERAISLLDG